MLVIVALLVVFIGWELSQWFFADGRKHPAWGEIFIMMFIVSIVTAVFSGWLARRALSQQLIHAAEIEAINTKLREIAITDAVTGVFNHRHFEIVLEQEWQRMQRLNHPLSCVMIDIDDFKKINDEYGHQAGDAILRQLAALLCREFREIDIISRYGGEEFTAILIEKPGHIAGLHHTMDRIRQKVAEERFYHEGKAIRITVSVGGAIVPESGATTPDELVRMADQAMYRAKNAGKNCCRT